MGTYFMKHQFYLVATVIALAAGISFASPVAETGRSVAEPKAGGPEVAVPPTSRTWAVDPETLDGTVHAAFEQTFARNTERYVDADLLPPARSRFVEWSRTGGDECDMGRMTYNAEGYEITVSMSNFVSTISIASPSLKGPSLGVLTVRRLAGLVFKEGQNVVVIPPKYRSSNVMVGRTALRKGATQLWLDNMEWRLTPGRLSFAFLDFWDSAGPTPALFPCPWLPANARAFSPRVPADASLYASGSAGYDVSVVPQLMSFLDSDDATVLANRRILGAVSPNFAPPVGLDFSVMPPHIGHKRASIAISYVAGAYWLTVTDRGDSLRLIVRPLGRHRAPIELAYSDVPPLLRRMFQPSCILRPDTAAREGAAARTKRTPAPPGLTAWTGTWRLASNQITVVLNPL